MTKPKQGELEGMRPKKLVALDALVNELLDAKEDQKRAKDAVDIAGEKVASALKLAVADGKLDQPLYLADDYVVMVTGKESVTVKPRKKLRAKGSRA